MLYQLHTMLEMALSEEERGRITMTDPTTTCEVPDDLTMEHMRRVHEAVHHQALSSLQVLNVKYRALDAPSLMPGFGWTAHGPMTQEAHEVIRYNAVLLLAQGEHLAPNRILGEYDLGSGMRLTIWHAEDIPLPEAPPERHYPRIRELPQMRREEST